LSNRSVTQGFDIRDIGEFTKSVTQDIQITVHDLDRLYRYRPDAQWRAIYLHKIHPWLTGVCISSVKDVPISRPQIGYDSRQSVQWNVFLLPEIYRPDIIQPADVIIVFVCEEDSIDIRNLVCEHLLSEVRAYINRDRGTAISDKNRSSQSAVMWIG
jgi:hypothetical protein